MSSLPDPSQPVDERRVVGEGGLGTGFPLDKRALSTALITGAAGNTSVGAKPARAALMASMNGSTGPPLPWVKHDGSKLGSGSHPGRPYTRTRTTWTPNEPLT
ncbi:hypothetical protein C6V83_05285 [Gordonia iterans]|uniref:Uncharacterized protein n=1 Tax=Gordonia iterans TaxID=1004901 RepID=A0A2S0KDK6_9ACTN|nr:hypothetical protein C6V83_05285 [Gordonia iterans]